MSYGLSDPQLQAEIDRILDDQKTSDPKVSSGSIVDYAQGTSLSDKNVLGKTKTTKEIIAITAVVVLLTVIGVLLWYFIWRDSGDSNSYVHVEDKSKHNSAFLYSGDDISISLIDTDVQGPFLYQVQIEKGGPFLKINGLNVSNPTVEKAVVFTSPAYITKHLVFRVVTENGKGKAYDSPILSMIPYDTWLSSTPPDLEVNVSNDIPFDIDYPSLFNQIDWKLEESFDKGSTWSTVESSNFKVNLSSSSISWTPLRTGFANLRIQTTNMLPFNLPADTAPWTINVKHPTEVPVIQLISASSVSPSAVSMPEISVKGVKHQNNVPDREKFEFRSGDVINLDFVPAYNNRPTSGSVSWEYILLDYEYNQDPTLEPEGVPMHYTSSGRTYSTIIRDLPVADELNWQVPKIQEKVMYLMFKITLSVSGETFVTPPYILTEADIQPTSLQFHCANTWMGNKWLGYPLTLSFAVPNAPLGLKVTLQGSTDHNTWVDIPTTREDGKDLYTSTDVNSTALMNNYLSASFTDTKAPLFFRVSVDAAEAKMLNASIIMGNALELHPSDYTFTVAAVAGSEPETVDKMIIFEGQKGPAKQFNNEGWLATINDGDLKVSLQAEFDGPDVRFSGNVNVPVGINIDKVPLTVQQGNVTSKAGSILTMYNSVIHNTISRIHSVF